MMIEDKKTLKKELIDLRKFYSEAIDANTKLFDEKKKAEEELELALARIERAIGLLENREMYDDSDFESMKFQKDVIKALKEDVINVWKRN